MPIFQIQGHESLNTFINRSYSSVAMWGPHGYLGWQSMFCILLHRRISFLNTPWSYPASPNPEAASVVDGARAAAARFNTAFLVHEPTNYHAGHTRGKRQSVGRDFYGIIPSLKLHTTVADIPFLLFHVTFFPTWCILHTADCTATRWLCVATL